MKLTPIGHQGLHQGDTVLCYLDANTSTEPIEGTFVKYCDNGWEIAVEVPFEDDPSMIGCDYWPIDECFTAEGL